MNLVFLNLLSQFIHDSILNSNVFLKLIYLRDNGRVDLGVVNLDFTMNMRECLSFGLQSGAETCNDFISCFGILFRRTSEFSHELLDFII